MGQRTFRCMTWVAGVFSASVIVPYAWAIPPEPLAADQLDWQAWGSDRPAGEVCSGHYVMPPYLLDEASGQVRGQSDNAGYGTQGETILDGRVILRQGEQQMQARQATLSSDRSRIDLEGPITYRQPGLLLRGSDGTFALKGDAANVDSAHFVFHNARLRGDAQRIERLDDGRYRVTNGGFTTCEPQSRLWSIVGSDITINRAEGYGTATHSRLHFYDVPVFYWPWIRFPIDDRRLTGTLYPTVSLSSSNGFDYQQPFYLNLAPNYDAMIVPRYMTDRGWMLGGQFRYLLDSDKGTIDGAYLGRDRGGSDDFDRQNRLLNEKRWYINFQHEGRFTPRTTYQLKYGSASDGDYFRDFGSTFAEQDTNHLERRAQIDYSGDVWQLQARARGYQVMDFPVKPNDEPFYELPSLSANARWQQDNGFYEEWNSNATYFDRNVNWDQIDNVNKRATGTRVNLAPAIGFRRTPAWGFFEPRLQLYHTRYDVRWHGSEKGRRDDEQTRTVPVFSLDSGLVFERRTQLFGSRWRQTLEPRLYYAYVPERDQDNLPAFDTDYLSPSWSTLWTPYRFNGIDRIGDVNKVSYGLSSRLLEDDTGRERLSVAVGQSHYFEDRKVTDGQGDDYYANHREYSPAIGQVNWAITDRYRVSYSVFYDTERGRTERNETYLHYKHPQGHAFNLGYRWQVNSFDLSGDRNDRINYNRQEYDASFAWKMTSSISLVGRFLYDHTHDRALEKLAGVQFNDCCYGVELAWREVRDDRGHPNDFKNDRINRGLFLRFILKGLGGVGNNPETYYQEAIEGYDPVLFQ